jgi:predicted alpha/beta hydrolase family esterase
MESLPAQKRTNVRSQVSPVERWIVGAVARVSPDTAASWAAEQFFKPRRPPRPRWEAELLEGARPGRVATVEGDLPVWAWGRGPAIVLVHGWEGRGSQLAGLVEGLVRAGRSVVAFDAPAHGDAPGASASILDMARAVEAVASSVEIEGFVAHSVGCAAVMIALSRAPLAKRAAFVAPPLTAARWSSTYARTIGLPREAARRFHDKVEARLAMPSEALDARLLGPREPLDLLVVHDADDHEVRIDDGRAVARAWHARRVVETRGLGHRRILRNPEASREIVRFLTGFEMDSGLAGLERELYFRDTRWVA